MYIGKLSLVNYKNYSEAEINLHNKLNCFVGNNGVGKTNLLDAVYYLCMCKSYFHSSDKYSIRQGHDFMVLQGSFINSPNEVSELYCGLKIGKKKQFRKNKKEYPRLSDHIGQFPVVMVSPADSALITEGSEERRKYMNAVISQFNRSYLEDTIQYNKVLLQRNKLLKEMRGYSGSSELLDVYDDQLSPLAESIHQVRNDFVSKLTGVFQSFYSLISDSKEKVGLEYISQAESVGNFSELLKGARSKDMLAQHTTVGVHRDDLELTMDDMPIKKIGSQGQQKTFLVSLKLAQFQFLNELKGVRPILLLDDIFDKFDATRVKQILSLVSEDTFGQIFITHTNEARMRELLQEFHGAYTLFQVNDGQVTKVV